MTNENYQPRGQKPWEHVVALVALLGVVLMLFFTSCSPRIIEKVVVQHDTTKVVVRDSVTFYDRDSIFVKEKGDTVYKYVEKWRYRDRWHTDTLVRVKIDSVCVEKVVEVTKPLSPWKKWQIRGFWALSAGVLLVLLGWILKRKLKL